MKTGDKWDNFKHKLNDKYKLTVINKAFEEKFSLELSKLNVFVVLSLGILFLIIITTILIAFTPLKEYIPGYGSTKQNKKLFQLQVQVDSLSNQLNAYELYTENLRQVFVDEDFSSDTNAFVQTKKKTDKASTFAFSKQDSMLLSIELQKQEGFESKSAKIKQKDRNENHLLFQPIIGKVVQKYSPRQPEIGIVTLKRQAVYAITGGTVIYAKPKDMIWIQHPNNMISTYRNFDELLVETNEYVKDGQIIAHTSADSSITYFGLWNNGQAVNPLNYILF